MKIKKPNKLSLKLLFPLAGAGTAGLLMLLHTLHNILGSSTSTKLKNISNCYPSMGLKPLKTRNDIAAMLEERKFKTGIEVGVQKGQFARWTLDRWPSCEQYHLVDIWKQQENYKDVANVDNSKQNSNFQKTLINIKPYEDKVVIHRNLSTDAAKDFHKESIDYVYIDARHDYCGVKADIEHYWPIVKPGGIIAGHDYNENSEIGDNQDWGLCSDGTRNDMAVKGAVNDFFLPKGLTISVTYYREQNWMSWMVQKPLC